MTHGEAVAALEEAEFDRRLDQRHSSRQPAILPKTKNWDALADCLHDWHRHWHWHGPGPGNPNLAILIDDSDDLLGTEFLGLFVSVLCQAAWNANLQLDADGIPHEDWPPFALHFVFLLEHTAPTAFARAAAEGEDVGVVLTDGRLTATLTGDDWPGADPVVPFPVERA